MRIYIPDNLRNIEMIQYLRDMLSEYQNYYYKDQVSSFDQYEFYLKCDPVYKFVELSLRSQELPEEIVDNLIQYYSELFYAVKGSFKKIIELMEKYLKILVDKEKSLYKDEKLTLVIKEISIVDSNYNKYLLEFLKQLLYFKNVKGEEDTVVITIENKNISIKEDINLDTMYFIHSYRINEVKNEDSPIQ